MPYAAEGRVSSDPIDGGVEISDAQYQEALVGMATGKLISIEGGFAIKERPLPEEPPEPETPPTDPLTVPIPIEAFWPAVEDLLGLTKYGILTALMSNTTLTEAEKFDAMTNIVVRDRYRWEDGNFQKMLPLFGYPAEQAADLWAYIVEHYVNA